MPAVTRRNQQLISDDYREDTATIENTSPFSASPVLIEPPITPRTTYAALSTPPHTTQGPPTAHPAVTSLTMTSEALLLSMHHMMQQIQADLAESKARIAELEERNRELREEGHATRNLRSPSFETNTQQRTAPPGPCSSPTPS